MINTLSNSKLNYIATIIKVVCMEFKDLSITFHTNNLS